MKPFARYTVDKKGYINAGLNNKRRETVLEAHVNEECILCGICADMCPEVFELGDEIAVVILKEIPPEHQDCCREAAEDCPTEAIEITE